MHVDDGRRQPRKATAQRIVQRHFGVVADRSKQADRLHPLLHGAPRLAVVVFAVDGAHGPVDLREHRTVALVLVHRLVRIPLARVALVVRGHVGERHDRVDVGSGHGVQQHVQQLDAVARRVVALHLVLQAAGDLRKHHQAALRVLLGQRALVVRQHLVEHVALLRPPQLLQVCHDAGLVDGEVAPHSLLLALLVVDRVALPHRHLSCTLRRHKTPDLALPLPQKLVASQDLAQALLRQSARRRRRHHDAVGARRQRVDSRTQHLKVALVVAVQQAVQREVFAQHLVLHPAEEAVLVRVVGRHQHGGRIAVLVVRPAVVGKQPHNVHTLVPATRGTDGEVTRLLPQHRVAEAALRVAVRHKPRHRHGVARVEEAAGQVHLQHAADLRVQLHVLHQPHARGVRRVHVLEVGHPQRTRVRCLLQLSRVHQRGQRRLPAHGARGLAVPGLAVAQPDATLPSRQRQDVLGVDVPCLGVDDGGKGGRRRARAVHSTQGLCDETVVRRHVTPGTLDRLGGHSSYCCACCGFAMKYRYCSF
eukprot:Rhum_TRINITY_DN19062_c0_g1::Rhum_TRINITY_DN19062_c0_g1_i1::g.169177::m.169177